MLFNIPLRKKTNNLCGSITLTIVQLIRTIASGKLINVKST